MGHFLATVLCNPGWIAVGQRAPASDSASVPALDVVVVAGFWMLQLPLLVALNSFVAFAFAAAAAAGAFPFEKLP